MSGYIGIEPIPKASQTRMFGVISSDTSTITVPGGFVSGNLKVFINGLYIPDTDYDDSDGSTIDFSPTTLTAGTEYIVEETVGFSVAQHYTKTEADTRFARLSGGTDANFIAMPQVGGDPIVESGSNADGEWTRWADGTQVVSGYLATTTAGSVQTGDSVPVTFPLAFLNLPKVSVALDGAFASRTIIALESLTSSSMSGSHTPVFNDGTNRSLFFHYLALGRWK